MPRAKKPMVLMGILSEREARAFLVDLANLQPFNPFEWSREQSREKQFLTRWGKLFPEYDLTQDEERLQLSSFVLMQLNGKLREVWTAATLREREWLLHDARWYYNQRRVDRSEEGIRLERLRSECTEKNDLSGSGEADRQLSQLRNGLPPVTPVDVALQYFGQILNRATTCQNPLCPHPYFFTRKYGQRFCSAACAEPAQREAKLRWWDKRGAEWRKQQKKKRKSKTKE
jgi:hypothetical protein